MKEKSWSVVLYVAISIIVLALITTAFCSSCSKLEYDEIPAKTVVETKVGVDSTAVFEEQIDSVSTSVSEWDSQVGGSVVFE